MSARLVAVYHRPGPKPQPTQCKGCQGIGTIIWATCQCHPNDPGCSHAEEERDCNRCWGSGRICPGCEEPMGLSEPSTATECRECIAAQAEDVADNARKERMMEAGR